MSWSIYKLGNKEEAKKIVADSQSYPEGSLQHALAKTTLSTLLRDHIPNDAIVRLSASGHNETRKEGSFGRFEIIVEYDAIRLP